MLRPAVAGRTATPQQVDTPGQGAGNDREGAAQPGTAQAEATPGEPAQPPAQDLKIHPDAVSSFVTRTYRIRPKKLWKELLESLKASGYPPEDIEEERMTVKTSFVDVKEADFPEPIGDRPPEFAPDYPILQLTKVYEGKVSLEGIVAPEGRGAALSLRARILVHGLDRRRHLRVLTDRRSSGVIEKEFLKKLETALSLAPL